MNLLSHLWDDTVAGPPPDDGLGKLRKFSTFNSRSDSGKAAESEAQIPNQRSLTVDTSDDGMRVTKSIMILKSPRNQSKDSPPQSPSPSPAGSTPPVSPFFGAGGREAYRFKKRSASFAYENARGIGPRSPPPPYDL
ncbi:unnamed protein product [Cuscuta epithymum]|uniref:Uncharacterized protein n=1 Tax=Cuscuta epithymum TaxID=186058 RepID=A0AAV0CF34_9ASTE|nr:unnamed protein product [Cuscuta epithymum]